MVRPPRPPCTSHDSQRVPRVSGLTDEWARLMEALRSLRADRRRPDDGQAIVERLVVEFERIVYRS